MSLTSARASPPFPASGEAPSRRRSPERLLYEVALTDPLTLGSLAVAMLAVAVLATYLPARRASGADPSKALRSQ